MPPMMGATVGIQDVMQKMGLASDSELKETYFELIDAAMDGANINDLMKNTTTCVHNIEKGSTEISATIMYFVNYGWSWDNYLNFNGALGNLTPIIRVCYDVIGNSTTSLQEHFSKFQNFVDFVNQAKNNAVKNIFTWYDIYARLQDAITRAKNKDAAFQIGRAARLLLDFPPQGVSQVQQLDAVTLPDLRWLEDFARGFLNGTRVFSSDRIRKCINETDFVVQSFVDGNNCFANGTTNPFRCMVFEVADISEHLRPFNEECYYAGVDVYKVILNYIDTFKTPLDILFNALRNFMTIY
eukprot:CAMPEP_0168334654 /NCGR_PEP_ID=MMETSP0213-20121227/10412_1 /TAXON_ID=151035 /ORGANISM="Euplotes harpa, Strain FSP1.4" /LENGTH=297 /DNA_ID=CAMNT_0008339371 /DNA_START=62 /DNA_END=952 /DNA_ORIENTATION=+